MVGQVGERLVLLCGKVSEVTTPLPRRCRTRHCRSPPPLDGTGQHAAAPDLGVLATALAHGAGGRATRSLSCRYVGRSAERKPRHCRAAAVHATAAPLDGTGRHAARRRARPRCCSQPLTARTVQMVVVIVRHRVRTLVVLLRRGVRIVWRRGLCRSSRCGTFGAARRAATPAPSARSPHGRCGLRAANGNHQVSRRRITGVRRLPIEPVKNQCRSAPPRRRPTACPVRNVPRSIPTNRERKGRVDRVLRAPPPRRSVWLALALPCCAEGVP